MSFVEDQITIEHEGHQYSATYTVEGGVVCVMMKDMDGFLRGTSTFIDGTAVHSVARALFSELLREVGVF